MFARTYREVFLAHQPAHQGRMTGPGVERKFVKVHHPITDRELDAHFTGQLTLAAPLIGPDDLAYIAAIDLDAGGETVLRQLLREAQRCNLVAFAITSSSPQHDGGELLVIAKATRLQRCASRSNWRNTVSPPASRSMAAIYARSSGPISGAASVSCPARWESSSRSVIG